MKKRGVVSMMISVALALSMPMTAMAGTYDISEGNIEINATASGQEVKKNSVQVEENDPSPIITGSSTTNTVIINTEAGCTANVTFQDLNIDVSGCNDTAAVKTAGGGNVTIELNDTQNNTNSLQSGHICAGLQKENGGQLTITDRDGNGSLTAFGGQFGAGIGGGYHGAGSNITISGGTVTATGADGAAGIGGGIHGAA